MNTSTVVICLALLVACASAAPYGAVSYANVYQGYGPYAGLGYGYGGHATSYANQHQISLNHGGLYGGAYGLGGYGLGGYGLGAGHYGGATSYANGNLLALGGHGYGGYY